MSFTESPSTAVCRRAAALAGGDPTRTVVWVRGHHDVVTKRHLWWTLVDATRLDGGDLVVDLSGVRFMDASTVGALVGANNWLRTVSRTLTVRDPSPKALLVLALCGLTHLIDPPAEVVHPLGSAAALSTWVAVANTGPPMRRAPNGSVAAPPAQAKPAGSQAVVAPNGAGP